MTPLPSTMDDNAPPAVLKNRAPARPWNAEEDTLLRAAVAKRETNFATIYSCSTQGTNSHV